ncbi:hypothetical protein F53441_4490 [Fusarium austroafricanum]|uniref:Uncharacterized protein n=1 Tax=Fusarium austroafricanum TaxID=2364996 RepID=A0A8H4KP14_9HYPO|nr:hypothetical protein F53441_4490 [Fusarium austroafricanum]
MEKEYFEEDGEYYSPVDDDCEYIDIENRKLNSNSRETYDCFSTSASSSSSSASNSSSHSFPGLVLPYVGDNRNRQSDVLGFEDLLENARKNKVASRSGMEVSLSSPLTSSACRTTNVTIDEFLDNFPDELITWVDDDINPVFISLEKVKERLKKCNDIIAGRR